MDGSVYLDELERVMEAWRLGDITAAKRDELIARWDAEYAEWCEAEGE